MPAGTDVDRWVAAHAQLTPQAQSRFSIQEMRTIYRTKMSDLRPEEFQLTMAMAARYDLDPMANEIWGTRGNPKDGEEGKLLILVGRDGLLKVGRRQKSWHGFDGDVVRKNDTFKVRRSKEGREIIHEYEGSAEDRGTIIGAWAQVYQTGVHDTYFFAPWSEYAPKKYSRSWDTTPSVMIHKCALSLCLRLAFNLSGVLAEEEAARVWEKGDSEVDSLADLLSAFPEHLRDRFQAAYTESQALRPGLVTPAAVAMRVTGQDEHFVEEYISMIEIANHEARVARGGDAPVDAEVIEVDPDVAKMRIADLEEELRSPDTDVDKLEEISGEIEYLEGQLKLAGVDD